MTTLATLPDEVVDGVVEQCDRAAQRAMCLVSRRFLAAARVGLMRDVKIRSSETLRSLLDHVRRRPGLAHHVRSMQIVPERFSTEGLFSLEEAEEAALDVNQMIEVMEAVSPSLETLGVVAEKACLMAVLRVAAERTRSLRWLHVADSGDEFRGPAAWASFYEVVTRHRSTLRHIDVKLLSAIGSASQPPSDGVAMPSLRVAECAWANDALTHWLIAEAPELRELATLTPMPVAGLAPHVASRIVRLQVTAINDRLDLSGFHRLEILHWGRVWSRAHLRTLETLPPSVIELRAAGIPETLAILEALLDEGRLPRLARLRWTLHCERFGPEPASYAIALRAACAERAIDCSGSEELCICLCDSSCPADARRMATAIDQLQLISHQYVPILPIL